MKNNTFSVQYSDEIITESISRAHEGKYCPWARIIGPFSNLFKINRLLCFGAGLRAFYLKKRKKEKKKKMTFHHTHGFNC
jgi:hypothetical protein